jgi:hypothetical protein
MLIPRQRLGLVALAILLCGIAAEAQAQPGQPVVQINGDFSATVSYSAPTAPPASGALAVATFNGAPYPGSPFNVGQATTFLSPPLAPGDYTVQILWDTVASPVTAFTVSTALGAPFLRAAGVDLNKVLLSWDPAPGVVSGYDIEGTLLSLGVTYTATIGNQTSVTVGTVPPGTYLVRIRARNSAGPGPYSNTITVVVGEFLALGDMQVSLTWNQATDMDLHLLEPDGTHVFHGRRQGTSARLDFDDVDGFGPENMFVDAGRALPGMYGIYLVHNSRNLETTSTITVTLGVNTNFAKTLIFTRRSRQANPGQAILVATVNVRTGEVVEMINRVPVDWITTDAAQPPKPR